VRAVAELPPQMQNPARLVPLKNSRTINDWVSYRGSHLSGSKTSGVLSSDTSMPRRFIFV
jgi:hypothetical protein